MGGGSFALPLLRTEPALRATPVFRSAYFPKKLFSFFSKTLDLQPLCGLRWAGEASLSPCSAPKCPFRTFRCFAWLIHDFAPSPMRALVFRSAYSASRNARASAAFAASIKAHRAVSSKTLMPQVRCAHPPMPHRTSSSSCSGVPVGLFSEKALQLFLQNARPSAAVRPPMGGGSFAPPCTPLSCPCRTDLSSVQKTPHLFSDGQTGCNSARTLLFPLPG